MIQRANGEEDFRPLAGLNAFDRRDLMALMDEVAETYPPQSDENLILFSWVTTVVERWMERDKPVPAKLMASYLEVQAERQRCVEVAECLGQQIRTLPPEHRKAIASEVLGLLAQRHREGGEMVPMWIPIARELFGPESEEEWTP
jgi:hypothetical protein